MLYRIRMILVEYLLKLIMYIIPREKEGIVLQGYIKAYCLDMIKKFNK